MASHNLVLQSMFAVRRAVMGLQRLIFLVRHTMSNELIALYLQLGHLSQRMKNRKTRLQGLFGGRNKNLLQPIHVHRLAFRVFAKHKRQLIYSHLHTFLNRQLRSVDVLRWRNNHMNMSLMKRLKSLRRTDLHLTMLAMRISDHAMIELPYSICHEYLIACTTTQHLHTMRTLFFRERQCRCYFRAIKQIHLFEIYSSDSFSLSAFSATCRASITPCISPSMNAAKLYTV